MPRNGFFGVWCCLAVAILSFGSKALAGSKDRDGDGIYQAAAPGAPSRPVIVYQAGLGDGAGVWRKVMRAQPDMPHFAFTRAGYEGRAKTTDSRDPCSIARELHAALQARGLRAPYVLVGHSPGGQYQYAFARLYPQEVAGLVLVDATHPDHWIAMQREAKEAASTVRLLKATLFSGTMRREFDGQGKCLSDFPVTAFPFPVRVLTKTKADNIDRANMMRMEHRLQQDWLRLTGAQSVQAIPDSGHYIQKEQPQAVVDAIWAVIADARH